MENVAGSGEYHWMAGNFLKYAGPLTWDDLPIDAHELVALCAPRPVFISSGSNNGDAWVDAKGMFLAAVGAGPVYNRDEMMKSILKILVTIDVVFLCCGVVSALGQTQYVDFVDSQGSFRLAQKDRLATLYVDSRDYAGVVRAAKDLQADIKRVTDRNPLVTHEQTGLGKKCAFTIPKVTFLAMNKVL
ncbi:MAG: hypothetical protein ISS70_03875 [Phycisphaerae bacterium]|nr:hypothetical protein [Phycisphaerae bacterium]